MLPKTIVDLGCGVGVLLVAALRQWPHAEGVGADGDVRAIQCAQQRARNERASIGHHGNGGMLTSLRQRLALIWFCVILLGTQGLRVM